MAVFTSHMPTVYVVTPCLNAAGTIDRTMQSVVTQAGRFHLHYHIQDGGSSDGTWERVLWWQRHIDSAHFSKSCETVTLTAQRERDEGLYDAISKGFDSVFRIFIPAESFLTWINADDILFQGAVAYVSQFERQFTREQVSWIAGATAIIKDDGLIFFHDRQLPHVALRGGLCDGQHWDYLQQEGVFFRGWLWRSALAKQCFSGMRLAGDWNLWRQFAQQAHLVQSNYPLGAFRVRDGQLSVKQRNFYLREIDAKISPQERRQRMQRIFDEGPPYRRVARGKYPTPQIIIYQENLSAVAETRYTKLFGKPTITIPSEKTRQILQGAEQPKAGNSNPWTAILDSHHTAARGFMEFDNGWQYPAITEKHAYAQLKSLWCPAGEAACYIAFPWATAIDHLQCGTREAADWLRLVRQFAKRIPTTTPKVTVCQHILMKQHAWLFHECGINELFWAHATKKDVQSGKWEGIRIHPFPLYPVQVVSESQAGPKRDLLFSFIGAQTSKYYMTDVRTWILHYLEGQPRALIRQRDTWHYKADVYDQQIYGLAKTDERSAATTTAAAEFRDVMSRSIFSLCPSGTGPNSIRLWESLGSGAIPVIIADTLALPGPQALWKEAAVFCPETEEGIKALPDQLAKMAEDADLLERKRLAMRQLWLMYGPDCFVPDVLKLLVDQPSELPRRPAAPEQKMSEQSLDALVGVAREITAGRADLLTASSILWRGLYTRTISSKHALQTAVRSHPEVVSAARMTRKLLDEKGSQLWARRVAEALPELE